MDKQKNIMALYEQIRSQNEELMKYIKVLEEENTLLKNGKDADWINAKIFIDAVNDAKRVKEEYEKARNEIYELKKEYKEKLNELLRNY